MGCKVDILDKLIRKGIEAGKLADCEIVNAINQDASLDINDIYDELLNAGVTVVPEYSADNDNYACSDLNPKGHDEMLNALGQYLQEIGQFPILSPADEQFFAGQVVDGKKAKVELAEKEACSTAAHKAELELRIQQGDEAKKQLIESNLRFVVFLAKQFETQNVSLLDLIQSGNIGLISGIDHYDPDKGFRLTTYVGWWIRQSIMRDLANTGKLIRLPANVLDKLRKVNNAFAKLEQITSGQVTRNDVSELTGLDVQTIEKLQRLPQDICSLDNQVLDDESTTFGDMIVSDELGPDELYEYKFLSEALHATMEEVLSPREIIVIVLRMGMDGHKAHTLEEVGNILHLTRERIRQIERTALRKMRTTKLKKRYIDFTMSGAGIKGD